MPIRSLPLMGAIALVAIAAVYPPSNTRAAQRIETGVRDQSGDQYCIEAGSITLDQRGFTHYRQMRCNKDGSFEVAVSCAQNMNRPVKSYLVMQPNWLAVDSAPNSDLTNLLRFVCRRAQAR